jgi:hypothetical protein
MTSQQPIASVTPIASEEPAFEDMRWAPQPGPELAALLAHKLDGKPDAQLHVSSSSLAILGRGVPPGVEEADTGLVIGYVQSGKTLSFTAVMALARDNGFQLIIVIAGSSAQLSDQSHKRIRDDLRAHTDGRRVWAIYPNPKPADAAGVEGLLDQWRDPHVPPEQRQTVVVTVMKQHTHLRNLARMLRKLDLSGISALIIDDEADQASLNTQAQQAVRLRQEKQSTTYRRLMEMRGLLPSHTYLQYTATPQAPLLISLIDSLSARWVEVLQPGDGYTGGVTFFGPPRDRRPNQPPPTRPAQHTSIVRIIPASEIPSANSPLVAAPESLQFALRLFMVGVAAAYARNEATGGNRSMLVHPSVRTADHQTYFNWINDLFHSWQAAFRRGMDDPAAQALAATFRPAYDDLAASVGTAMPSFEDMASRLRTAFNSTELKEVNRRQNGPPVIIEWRQRYGWILVGGQAMDRGFTVEGLTITYMPRGLGGGQADTLQQRARFFGYKAGYLGYCRVFLERDARQGFEDYIEHEEFMRRDMIAVRDNRQPLQTWPRRFVLDPALRLCRDNVLRDGYSRAAASTDDWFTPQSFMGAPDGGQVNQGLVATFLAACSFTPDEGRPSRTDTQRHLVSDPLPLREVADRLLADYRIRDPNEVEKWTTLLAILGNLLDEDDTMQAVVYQMSSGRIRRRAIYATGRVKQLFQGEAPVEPMALRGSVYPGDKAIFREGMVTIQIHTLDLTNDASQTVASGIPFLAIRLPADQARPMAIQVQPGQPTFGAEDPD